MRRLSLALQEALTSRYGRLPSAAFVAREFNLRCDDHVSISDETARRWIRGSSLPSVARLAILGAWLDIDFNAALGFEQPSVTKTCQIGLAFDDSQVPRSTLEQLLCQKIVCMDETRQQLLLGIVDAIDPQRISLALQKRAA